MAKARMTRQRPLPYANLVNEDDVRSEVSSLKTDVYNIGSRFDRFETKTGAQLDAITAQITERTKPNWHILMWVVGIILGAGAWFVTTSFAIIGFAAIIYDRDQSRLTKDNDRLSTLITNDAKIMGALGESTSVDHAWLNKAIDDIKDLDIRLQREFNLINDKTVAQSNSLDTRLQGEIKAVDANSLDRRNKTIAENEILSKRLDEIAPQVAKFAERINNVKDNSSAEAERLRADINKLFTEMKGLAALLDRKTSPQP